MAQIKHTVELLTKILKCNGTFRIKAEHFRQAKFDRDDATGPMWRLLFQTIYYIKYNKIDDVTVKAYSELSEEELCVFVKTEMKQRGFCSRSFHELPTDLSSGSRELLLAFGWLMCRSELINTFMDNCCSSLQTHQTQLPIEMDASFPERKLDPPTLHTTVDKVKYLMWLNGKLRMNLRNLYSLQQQKDSLTQAISKATMGVSTNPELRNSLTPLEVMMIQNPQLLKKNLKLLDADNERLEALVSWWPQHDNLFWKWMESVLDAKVASSGLIDEISDGVTPRTSAVKQRVDSRLELAETVGKYAAVVQHIEKDLLRQADSHSVGELDSLLTRLDEEISRHRSRLYPSAVLPVARIKPVARSPERRPARGAMLGDTSSSEAEIEIEKIEGELNELQELVERLKLDIQYKQKSYLDDISTVSSGSEYISRGAISFLSSHR